MRYLKLSLFVIIGLAIGLAAELYFLRPWLTEYSKRPQNTPQRLHEDYHPKLDFSRIEDRYLSLLKLYLTRYDFGYTSSNTIGKWHWPETAETMIGMARMDNLHACIKEVLKRNVPGDLIEAGAWRGGATIFMRAALEAYGDRERRVWVADSFQGLPKPRPEVYPDDAGDVHFTYEELVVPVNQVKANFARFGVLDDRVKFLVGWFKDTLPTAPIERLAILRVDADMYEGTFQALEYLYPKLSRGGYVIVDDYGAVKGCRKAVEDFRHRNSIVEEMKRIDWTGVYWEKTR